MPHITSSKDYLDCSEWGLSARIPTSSYSNYIMLLSIENVSNLFLQWLINMSKVVFSCWECENCLNNRHMADCLPFPCTRWYTKEDFEPYIWFSLTNIFWLKKKIIYPSYQDEPMLTPQEKQLLDNWHIIWDNRMSETATGAIKSTNKVSKIEQIYTTQEYTNELIAEAYKAIINLADTLWVSIVSEETSELLQDDSVNTVFDAIRDKSWYHNHTLKILIWKLKTISDVINNNL